MLLLLSERRISRNAYRQYFFCAVLGLGSSLHATKFFWSDHPANSKNAYLFIVDCPTEVACICTLHAGLQPVGGFMSTFELFAPTIFMACDLFSLQHAFFGFIGSLILPVILVVILASAMGGNGQNIAESLGDALAGCLVLALDLSLRLLRTLVLTALCLVSALWRIAISWRKNRSITLKTGPESGDS
jgi:hypothetical protein